jgi:predicted porin
MQKKIIALAVAGLMSGAAFAQSNVTVYGVADMYYARASAAGNATTNVINSGGLSGSRIGFKGVEDLGGGLKALFTLEYGLNADNKDSALGAGAATRQSFVGLTGGFGTVVAGSLQTAGYDFACANNPVGGSALDAYHKVGSLGTTRTLLSCGHDGRASNAFAYISPSFGGFTAAWNHARVTEAAGAQATRKDASANLLAATYANGPIGVNFVYSKISAAHTAASDDVKEWGLGGSYNLGVAKIGLQYQQNDNAIANGKNKKWGINAAAPVGAGAVVFAYAKGKVNETAANDNPKSWTLAYTHSLSKRTTAYAGYNRVSNGGDGTFASVIAPTAGGKSSVFAAGVRHTF